MKSKSFSNNHEVVYLSWNKRHTRNTKDTDVTAGTCWHHECNRRTDRLTVLLISWLLCLLHLQERTGMSKSNWSVGKPNWTTRVDFLLANLGKVSVISYVYFLFIYFILLIDKFFDVDSKSTIGFRRSHVVFDLWRFKITRKNLTICKKMYKKYKNSTFNY